MADRRAGRRPRGRGRSEAPTPLRTAGSATPTRAGEIQSGMTFKATNAPRNRRLIPARSIVGGPILVNNPTRTPTTPSRYGRQCEADAEQELRRAGWMVTRSHLSRGAADLTATKLIPGEFVAVTRLVQVKACMSWNTANAIRGYREILTAPPVWQREVWIYCHGRGHVASILIDADGATRVEAYKPGNYAADLRAALERVKSNANATPRRTGDPRSRRGTPPT
jgi:hypothetical protein